MSVNTNKLKVLIVATEVNPYAKSGGLGDVAGSLPGSLRRLGVDARVVMPKYKFINQEYLRRCSYAGSFFTKLGWRSQSASIYRMDGDAPIYLIENDYYFGRDGFYGYGDDFERFAFFSKAAVEFLNEVEFQPDVIHFNDWQTALGTVYLKDQYSRYLFYSKIKSLYSVHNLQYQGVFGRDILNTVDLNDGYYNSSQLEFYGNISFMKAGLVYADAVGTVSETYSKEIQTPNYGFGMDGILRSRAGDLYGILNGIDNDKYNPAADPRLYACYDTKRIGAKYANKRALQKHLGLPDRDVPMIGIISRLANQKGFDLISVAMEELISKDIQIVVLGTGEGRYEELFRHMSWRAKDKVSANIFFDDDLARKIYASSDIFLMPSLFEPCGLGQLFAMRYGSVPIVRKTGGLADTVSHYNPNTGQGTGFVFEDYNASGMMWAVNEALRAYRMGPDYWGRIVYNAMSADFSWNKSAEKYVELYEKLKES
ncbi:MAG: glycogen synthase GlgA [Clostridiales bacterium]|jgi:starch synthase|nr:glycogen synthase GlgA [Clostridiales bacterium]